MTGWDEILRKTDEITKCGQDKCFYRGLQLPNRMKIILVSDPTTDKAAAALDVNVGFTCDPDDLPGLAHFCEHMLFLGTEKYPIENDYCKFISEHGGYRNAFTNSNHTNFYFDIVPEQLKGALDRFVQFFISPLFTESATERELQAVNSEFENNVINDSVRIAQLDKHLSDNGHPYHKFGTGNKESLDTIPKINGINVRDALLKFHDEWYSSNIMCLAVLGKESLDELEELVVELFSEVKDSDVEPPIWSQHPFEDDKFQTCTYVVPVKDVRELELIFPCPDLLQYYKSVPNHYVSHLVGHEGPGSLLSALKEYGWSSSLMAGYHSPNRGAAFFGVSLDLTEEGLNHTDEIIKLVFQYFNMLKQTGPLKWIHDEFKDMFATNFMFKDKESPLWYVSELACNLHDYPFKDILSYRYNIREWRPEIITEVVNNLIPSKVRVYVTSKNFQNDVNLKEPWYGTMYKTAKIENDILEEWENVGLSDDLSLPNKNDLIPENLNLYSIGDDITNHPDIIKDTAMTRIWFKQDDKFLLPKCCLMFNIVSPITYFDPHNTNLTQLFILLFDDALNEYTYAAQLAGLSGFLTDFEQGLMINIGGYNDKQSIFLDKIMDKLTQFKIDPNRFEVFKETYIRDLKNFAAEESINHAYLYLEILLCEHIWTKAELLQATDKLTIDKLEAFIPHMLSNIHIECLIHGNVEKQSALDLIEGVEKKLNAIVDITPPLPRHLLLDRELELEHGCNYLYEVEIDVHKSSCAHIYYQCGLQSTEMNTMLDLLAQIIEEPCFDTLRTKEQLGYCVISNVRSSSGVQGLRIIVQSDKHPSFLDSRIETFITNMLNYLLEMSDEDFEKHKNALASQKLEEHKQLSYLAGDYWAEITNQQYNFDREIIEVAHLRTISKDQLIEFYQINISGKAESRRKLAVHVISMAEGGAGTLPLPDEDDLSDRKIIRDIAEFKSAHGLYSLLQPYIDVPIKGKQYRPR